MPENSWFSGADFTQKILELRVLIKKRTFPTRGGERDYKNYILAIKTISAIKNAAEAAFHRFVWYLGQQE
ncbi:hypothetical protein A6J64_019995 [Yersinia enterocolitica]|nr:hypothetical protein YWA314_10376 [Yersinia enterocolitica subsp. enterocolitica WA-314]PNM14096.1 hypothetical protein A6J64_019995 [Yersinia enterocolitica]RLZ01007.1 hypothetical protein COO51_04595 [Yersinia enterocolitica]